MDEANFTFFLPTGVKLLETHFRPEDPVRPYPRCSLRLLIETPSGARLSIKEFFYDWAPPAYDCPSLWKNHETFPDVDTPEPKPYLIGDDVFWIGVNYRNKRAASLIKERTTIESVLLEGNLSDPEWIDIMKGLQSQHINHTKTFAEMSYGYPHAVDAVNVPISFWKFPVAKSEIRFQTAFIPENVPEEILAGHLPLPKDCGYHLNSVFTYHTGDKPDKRSRANFVYEHESHKGSTIQLLHVHKDSPAASSFPPNPDHTQKFKHVEESIQGKIYYHAYRSEAYGPHELIFQRGDYNYLLIVKPTSWTSRDWLLRFLSVS